LLHINSVVTIINNESLQKCHHNTLMQGTNNVNPTNAKDNQQQQNSKPKTQNFGPDKRILMPLRKSLLIICIS